MGAEPRPPYRELISMAMSSQVEYLDQHCKCLVTYYYVTNHPQPSDAKEPQLLVLFLRFLEVDLAQIGGST